MPRRLLTISHSYVVGVNRRLAAEFALASRGAWEVTVAAPTFFGGDLREHCLEGYANEPYELVPIEVHLPRSLHLFTYHRKLRALLSRPWDVVHCWEEPYVLSGAQIALMTPTRVPLVFSTYQNIQKRYPPPFAQIERLAMARARGWIAGGTTVLDALRGRPGYRSLPHRVIPLGVDVDLFRPSPERRAATLKALGWSSEGPPVVGFLGRFVVEKGIRLLLEVLEQVRTPFRVLMVGGGPLESELRTWAARRPEAVRVVTGIPHDEVPAYLAAMDLLCAPSQTVGRWREQFGRMIVEAFACEVAVLGSDSGEIPSTIGDAGIVLGEADVNAWTQAIERLLGDAVARRDLALRGRARALECFAWRAVAIQSLDFFSALSDGSPRW